jgi:hypothetical protein
VELKGLEWRVARSEWRRVEWGEGERAGVESAWPDRSGGEWNEVELEGLEWRVARSEWRRVESGQIGVEKSGMG